LGDASTVTCTGNPKRTSETKPEKSFSAGGSHAAGIVITPEPNYNTVKRGKTRKPGAGENPG